MHYQTAILCNLFSNNIKTSKYDDIIIPRGGKSVDILPLFCEGKFDLVFVDTKKECLSCLHLTTLPIPII